MEYITEIQKVFPKDNNHMQNCIFRKIKQGQSNTNYQVTYNNKSVFLRIYGQKNCYVQNDGDLQTALCISNYGFGSKILHSFKNGRIEKWISSPTMTHSDINYILIKNIAKKLRQFHDVLNMNHNDLHFQNIFILEKSKSVDKSKNFIKFIDFEYVGVLDREYDIANFFLNLTHEYEKKDWYQCKLNLFPSRKFMELFLDSYGLFITVDDILSRMNDVNMYWISWAKKTKSRKYRLFEQDRLELINFDFKTLL